MNSGEQKRSPLRFHIRKGVTGKLRARRSFWIWLLPALLGLGAVSALLAVNTFPSMLNDSVVYLGYSQALGEYGWVTSGFRQVGYPLSLAVVRQVADLVGAEPLLATAVFQRLLLIAGGVLAWVLWRWWSLPLLAFLIAAETIAFTNFILVEGLGLPLVVLLVFPTVVFFHLVRAEPSRTGEGWLWLAGALVIVDVLVLMSLRFTYYVFAVIPLVMVVVSWRTPRKRFSLTLFSVFVLFAGAFTLALSFENQREYGVFSPNANGSPTEYYYAWVQTFSLDPANRENPELARFYDDGDLHDFGRALSTGGLSLEEQSVLYEQEIEAMLTAAGMSPFWSRLESAAWGLVGGRMNDVEPAIRGIVSSTRSDVDDQIHRTNFSVENGREAFAEQFNKSKLPQAVITDPVGVSLPLPHSQHLVAVLLPLALIVMSFGLTRADLRPLALVGLVVVVGMALGVGWIRADNYRFLIATSAFGLGIASDHLASLWHARRDSGSPGESV